MFAVDLGGPNPQVLRFTAISLALLLSGWFLIV
jgi:hypothetical protein